MKKILLIIAALLFANATNALQIDFSKDGGEKVFEIFDDTTQMIPDVVEGKLPLPERIVTQALPVEAGKKYKLQIVAQVDGPFVVEENERILNEVLRGSPDIPRSGYEIYFFDEHGEEFRDDKGNRKPPLKGFFMTKNAHPYVYVFHAPKGAVNLKVRFLSSGRTTYLTSLQLAEETEEGTVNVNPDFRYGELNYCGWLPINDGRLYKLPDGKVVLNTGHAAYSQLFPLTPHKTYRISITGEGASNVCIEYFSDEGILPLPRHQLSYPSPEGAQNEFMPPEGTTMGRLHFPRTQVLKEIRIEEVK